MHIIILPLQTGEIVAKSKIKAIEASADGIVPESNTFLPGNCQMHSCVKKNELQSSVRKALSPIKTNVNQKPLNELSSTDQLCPALFEPITPQRPCNLNSPNKSEMVGPSLDKFHARSSNLKVYKKDLHNSVSPQALKMVISHLCKFFLQTSLIQEYIGFLNTASK